MQPRGDRLTFDIYGRMVLVVERGDDAWRVFRLRDGRRTPFHDVVIPSHVAADGIETFLDDIFHEWAGPGDTIRKR